MSIGAARRSQVRRGAPLSFSAFRPMSEIDRIPGVPDATASCWFVTGPTAAGKTRVGLALAERIGGEILSLDSMAIYRGMDIGTAKPTAAQRQAVPHHLLDLVDPTEEFSLAQYLA